MNKITILGAGRVGESTAQILAAGELAHEIVLIDIRGGVARGAALDIHESAPLYGFDTRITGSGDVRALAGSQLVIFTAGQPRRPGMSRSDVLEANRAVVEPVLREMAVSAPEALLLMVTNPVDVLTHFAWQHLGWGRERVFGLSGVLDAARMATFIALETGHSPRDVNAMVLGGHGDAMVPLPRLSSIHGVPLSVFLDPGKIERIVARTRTGGAEILALKENSSANNSPAAAVAVMVDAIARRRSRVLPVVAVLDGEYGQQGLAMGVPVLLGERGVEHIIELDLTDDERLAFDQSAEGVRLDLARLN